MDWLTVSPKPQFHEGKETLVVQQASECKVVVDDTVDEAVLAGYEAMGYERYFLQPCMDARYEEHLAKAIALVQERPRWRLSVQMHKVIGVP